MMIDLFFENCIHFLTIYVYFLKYKILQRSKKINKELF